MIRRIRAERGASIKVIPESRPGDIPIAGEAARACTRVTPVAGRLDSIRFPADGLRRAAIYYFIIVPTERRASAPLHLPAGSKMYRKSYVHCAGVPRVYVPVFQITAPAFRVRSEIKRAEERGGTAARAAGPRSQRETLDVIDPRRGGPAAVELSADRAKYATSL